MRATGQPLHNTPYPSNGAGSRPVDRTAEGHSGQDQPRKVSGARGFERILGITIEDIDYLEGAIQTGILVVPVSSIRPNPPWGLNCVVMVPVRGRGEKGTRVVMVRTAWTVDDSFGCPRLATVYPRP